MAILYLINGTLMVFYFPPQLVGFIKTQHITGLVEIVIASRVLLLSVLTLVHCYFWKNFELQFAEDNIALTTSLMSKRILF